MAKNRAEIRKRLAPNDNPKPLKSHSGNNRKSHGFSMFRFFSRKFLLYLGAAVVILVALTVYKYRVYRREKVRLPLNLPKLVHPNTSSASVYPESYWGTYRPQSYLGLKTRHPQSPVFGLMWLNQLSKSMPPPIRHWCNQDDRLLKYGWLLHDGVNFGVQELEESDFVVKTEFVKRIAGENGGDWTTRVSVLPKVGKGEALVSLMFYMSLDGHGHVEPVIKKERLSGVKGVMQHLGYFNLEFIKPKSQTSIKQNYLISYVPRLDKISEVTMNGLRMGVWDRARDQGYFALSGRVVPREAMSGANFFMQQITGTAPFEFEVIFESGSVQKRPGRLTGPVFNAELNDRIREFNDRFAQTFRLESKGFDAADIVVAKAALSNMLGGVGYWHGSSLVKSPFNDEPVEYWHASLHTAVPSRSFFPRGFLWDEGFHNLLISRWDTSISRSILSHWMDMMNIEGWIPREQILGVEARAKVPAEFVVQRNENANPPTWFLVLRSLVSKLAQDDDNLPYLHVLYRRLKVWYSWYNTTQAGELPGTYRWRGRNPNNVRQLNPLTLTSGLDDYPRASHPTAREYHVDLRCWIALASGVMAQMSRIVGEDATPYAQTFAYLTDNTLLDALHWSPETQSYADYGLHTDAVVLRMPKPPAGLQPGQPLPPEYQEKIRVATKEPQYGFVRSFGYVSLFPLIATILEPSSPKLLKVLNDIKSPQLLWTDFGLRSLSKSAPMYNRANTQHDPPYWRGRIWINLNYLTVAALHHYASTQGPHSELASAIYTELRDNLIRNVIHQYKTTGYIWEQYDDTSGAGKGSHPFTGWSATFVLMMAEKY